MLVDSQPNSAFEDTSSEKGTGDKNDLSRLESCTVGEQVQFHEVAGTKRKIKSRQAQMIAIGGSIGTSLFVGSGQALARGGPAFLLIAYCLTSMLVYGVVTAIIEVAIFLPTSGCSVSSYCSRYVSRSAGFALGWLYFYSFGILVAYEITAASIVIDFWHSNINTAVWITIMAVVIVALNFSPVGVYAETEFWFAGVKVIMIIALLILSLVIMLGGGPDHHRIGFRYWQDPGAVKPYIVGGSGGLFTAFLSVWIFSGFSFYFSPELIVFTAGEMRNPRKNLLTASRRFFARLVVFYILSAIAIGAICASNSPGLTSSSGNADASPWVIAIRNASIPYMPSIINAGVLMSAWSSGNAYLYMSSRTLYSLALSGHAPKVFAKCNKYGLPIYAVIASSLFTVLAYLNCGSESGAVFNWFINLTNTSGYTSWALCCITFLRFRKACVTQGVSVPYRSHIQPYAAWVSLVIFVSLLLLNGFTVFYPGQFTLAGFLTTYLGIPIFTILWLGHKFFAARNDPWLHRPDLVDLKSGVEEMDADSQMWSNMEDAEKETNKGNGLLGKLAFLWS